MCMIGTTFSPSLLGRFAGAPVNFEEVEINESTTDPDFMHSALLSVERNGVAIKGMQNNSLFL